MKPITGEIPKLIEEFSRSNRYLYHACHLKDFQMIVDSSRLHSKKSMKDSSTRFFCDEKDKARGLDHLVFFNLMDLGLPFHYGRKAWVPNLYGSILFVLKPGVLRNAKDVSVTLTSITSCNRERDSLSPKEFEELYRGKYLEPSNKIKTKFPSRKVTNPEMNCTYADDSVPPEDFLDNIQEILVDPVVIDGIRLVDIVKAEISTLNPNLAYLVKQRFSQSYDLYNLLIQLADGKISEEFLNFNHGDWITRVNNLPPGPGFMLKSFLTYTQEGTIAPLKQIAQLQRRIG